MSAFRKIASVGVALVLCASAVSAQAAAAASNGDFDAGKFTCLNYTNGMGANSNNKAAATMAHVWMLGFLAGFYKASGKLEVSDDKADAQKLDDALSAGCKDNPANSVHAVASQAITKNVYKIPKSVTVDLATTYTCGDHLAAKTSNANKADLAELWAYAVVEGVKAVSAPTLEIPPENKAPIMSAVNRSCGNNKDMPYIDMSAAVADKIKMN